MMRSGLVQNLRIELANLERQQAQLLERYLDQHPEVVKVRNQIEETRTQDPRPRPSASSAPRRTTTRPRPPRRRASRPPSRRPSRRPCSSAPAPSAYDTQKREVDAATPGARRPHGPRQADGRRLRAQVHEHPHRGPRGRAPRPRPAAEAARHPARHPAGRLPEHRPRLLPRVPRQHPQDPGRRAAAPRARPSWASSRS